VNGAATDPAFSERGSDAWLGALARELRGLSVEPGIAGGILAEAAAHLADSGQSPFAAFGPPDRYAAAIVQAGGGPVDGGEAATTVLQRRPTTQADVLLEARGITKRLGRRQVLTGVDLVVRAGQIAAVVGANGSGKSTFLRVCAGLVAPDRGRIDVTGLVGYSPQEDGVCDLLDAEEHFLLIGAGRELSRTRARAAGRAHAGALGWRAPAGRQARHLSGGTRQKLNLVLAAIGDPDVLLLDEPYQGFDRATHAAFWDQLDRWRSAGKAIVLVTHLLEESGRPDLVLELPVAEEAAA
jgi:ABC-2 type transport system ATP-binding protein